MLMRTCAVVVVLSIARVIQRTGAAGWNYDGSGGEAAPSNWSTTYPLCGETKQSPINITSTAVSSTPTVKITLTGYDTQAISDFTLKNNGHSAQIDVNTKAIMTNKTDMSGNTYVLEQFHFHWGSSNSVGSEHSIDGKFYPLEIHFVHYNSAKYSDVSAAASSTTDTTGLLVIAVFVDEATTSNAATSSAETAFATLLGYFDKISDAGNTTTITPFKLEELFPCESLVYTYSGSLTTPTCAEVVNWNVFKQPVYISSNKLATFRALHGDNPSELLLHNYRPTQQLNGRTVSSYSYSCHDESDGGRLTHSSQATVGVAVLTVVYRVVSGIQ